MDFWKIVPFIGWMWRPQESHVYEARVEVRWNLRSRSHFGQCVWCPSGAKRSRQRRSRQAASSGYARMNSTSEKSDSDEGRLIGLFLSFAAMQNYTYSDDICVTLVTQERRMSLGFSESLLLLGAIAAVAAALSEAPRQRPERLRARRRRGDLARGADVVTVDAGSDIVEHSIELALILTLFSDGLVVERELLARHRGPAARALIIAMPVTMGLIALSASVIIQGCYAGCVVSRRRRS